MHWGYCNPTLNLLNVLWWNQKSFCEVHVCTCITILKLIYVKLIPILLLWSFFSFAVMNLSIRSEFFDCQWFRITFCSQRLLRSQEILWDPAFSLEAENGERQYMDISDICCTDRGPHEANVFSCLLMGETWFELSEDTHIAPSIIYHVLMKLSCTGTGENWQGIS